VKAALLATVALVATACVATPAGAADCAGAAARAPGHRCDDARLQYTVTPSPATARGQLNWPCTVIETQDEIHVCEFGAPADQAVRTIALIGDSHASHWRAALDVAARAKRWRGVSITETSCPLSTARRRLSDPVRAARCARWKPEVYGWLSAHPEVSTVFVSQLSGGTGVVAGRRDEFAVQVQGYRRAWHALPRSVRRVVVIRDVPKAGPGAAACIRQAMAEHKRPGLACARSRAGTLDPDPAAVAAARSRSRRIRLIDLTRFFCDRRRCYPVVGGVLVHKNADHMTLAFARSLGPFVQRALG
jgi:hypothetical protein